MTNPAEPDSGNAKPSNEQSELLRFKIQELEDKIQAAVEAGIWKRVKQITAVLTVFGLVSIWGVREAIINRSFNFAIRPRRN